uniref:Uncharacterized protein n=1 Tax=Anguilla anguilla TaxID=7936 RepID=A0A0E9PMW8_ANGAN
MATLMTCISRQPQSMNKPGRPLESETRVTERNLNN